MSNGSRTVRPTPVRRRATMAEIVNLRRARKGKARAEKDKVAQANRVAHGTPKALKKLEQARQEQTAQRLSGRRLEKPDADN